MLEALHLKCLGIGMIYRDAVYLNDHLDDEWPEGTPDYIKASLMINDNNSFTEVAEILDGLCVDVVDDVSSLIRDFDKQKGVAHTIEKDVASTPSGAQATPSQDAEVAIETSSKAASNVDKEPTVVGHNATGLTLQSDSNGEGKKKRKVDAAPEAGPSKIVKDTKDRKGGKM